MVFLLIALVSHLDSILHGLQCRIWWASICCALLLDEFIIGMNPGNSEPWHHKLTVSGTSVNCYLHEQETRECLAGVSVTVLETTSMKDVSASRNEDTPWNILLVLLENTMATMTLEVMTATAHHDHQNMTSRLLCAMFVLRLFTVSFIRRKCSASKNSNHLQRFKTPLLNCEGFSSF